MCGITLAMSVVKIKTNSMKKILFALCIAFAFSPAIAQNADGTGRGEGRMKMSAEERAAFTTDKMQEKLNLSADQHAKILAVNMEAGKRMQALRDGGSQPDRTAFEAIDKYRQEQYASILTPAQMEQWKAFRSEQRGMRSRAEGVQRPAEVPAKQEVPVTK